MEEQRGLRRRARSANHGRLRNAGRSDEAESLYRQALQVRAELVELEPGNTTYRRDLAVSYERIGTLAAAAGDVEEAQRRLTFAVGVRTALLSQESHRADLAEELGVALRLLAGVSGSAGAIREQVIEVLAPFEAAGTVTPKGTRLLSWARGDAA